MGGVGQLLLDDRVGQDCQSAGRRRAKHEAQLGARGSSLAYGMLMSVVGTGKFASQRHQVVLEAVMVTGWIGDK